MKAQGRLKESDHAACIVAGRFEFGYTLNAKMITGLSARIGRDFPFLMNHCFVLRVLCPDENSRNTT